MHSTVKPGARMPLAPQAAAQELRKQQEQALQRMGANALCPAPIQFPDGKVYHVESGFGFMPRAKV